MQGPYEINRYNMYTTAAIRGGPAKGYTEAELKKMSYAEVTRKFNIPPSGSNIGE